MLMLIKIIRKFDGFGLKINIYYLNWDTLISMTAIEDTSIIFRLIRLNFI